MGLERVSHVCRVLGLRDGQFVICVEKLRRPRPQYTIYNWPTLAITPAPRSPRFESQGDELAHLAEAIVCVSRPIFAWFFQLNENFAVGGSPQLCEPSISLDFRQIFQLSIGAPGIFAFRVGKGSLCWLVFVNAAFARN
jgi:hypothetical protein